MARSNRYQSTWWFEYYNANPRGIVTAGDCVVRAISTLTGISWDETLYELTQLGIERSRMPDDTILYGEYLKSMGYCKMKQARWADNTKLTGKEFVENFVGRCVAHIGGHHTVFINGKIYDTWDSTGGTIGNFWVSKQDYQKACEFIVRMSKTYRG